MVKNNHPQPSRARRGCKSSAGRGGSKAAAAKPRGRTSHRSTINKALGRSVELADLVQPDRLLDAHAKAVATGVIPHGPVDRLRFVAAALSAMKVRGKGGKPCAVFANNVNKQRWLFITEGDEQEAQRLLVAHDRRRDREKQRKLDRENPPPPPQPKPELSADAKMVGAALDFASGKGYDAYDDIIRPRGGWTRERFDNAKLELGLSP